MDEQVRVTGKKIDDLQQVQTVLDKAKIEVPIQYENYR